MAKGVSHVAFMQARGVPGAPAEYDAGINRGLGVPAAFYHFAFEAGNEPALLQKREELIGQGLPGDRDHRPRLAKSIYFRDPNGMSLE